MNRLIAAALLLGLAACSSAEPAASGPAAPPQVSASPVGASPGTSRTLWLCRPGLPANPCEGGLDATVVEARRRRSLVLGIDLGELTARPHRRRQHPLQHVMVDHPAHATGGPFGGSGGTDGTRGSGRSGRYPPWP